MDSTRTGRRFVAASLTAALVGTMAATASAQDGEPVTLTFLVDTTEVTMARTQALADAYTAMHPMSPSSSSPGPRVPRATTSSRPASRPGR